MRRWRQRPARPVLVSLLAVAWIGMLVMLILPDAESRQASHAFAYQRYADSGVLVSLVAADYPPALARWLRFDEAGQLASAVRVFERATRRERFPATTADHWALLFHRLGDPDRALAALDRRDGVAVFDMVGKGRSGSVSHFRVRGEALRDHLAGRRPDGEALAVVRENFEGEGSALPDWLLLAEWEEDDDLRRWLVDRGHRLVRRGLVADAIVALATLAGLLAGIWLWRRGPRPSRGFVPSKPFIPTRLPRTWGGWRFSQEALTAECLGIIGTTIVAMPLIFAGYYDGALLSSSVVFMAVPFWWLAWRLGPGPWRTTLLLVPELRDRPSHRAADGIAFGLAGGLLLAIGGLACEATGFGIDALGDTIQSDALDRPLAIVSTFFVATVLAPVFEELIFRGFLFGFLRSRWGPWPAALLSSAIFAAVHGYSGEGLAMVFGYGLVFAGLYQRSGSLLPGIVAHAVFNFAVTGQLVGWYSWH